MLDLCEYSVNDWSVKTPRTPIRIDDPIWNDYFNEVLANTEIAYFWGFRLNFISDTFMQDCCYLSNSKEWSDNKYMRLFFEIKPIHLMEPRRLLSSFWENYEFPALIFSAGECPAVSLLNCMQNRTSLRNIASIFDGLHILYKGIEDDVLWFTKSRNMPPLKHILHLK